MKIDVINTRFGNIDIEYSSFTKGFFIKKYPEKLEQINGLKLLKDRDNSFSDFNKLEKYVKELVHNAMIDFQFERKIIAYRINTNYHSDGLFIEWMVCDESVKNQKYMGKENELREYFVHDSNITGYIGKRNIFGQITFSAMNEFIFIDYEEDIYIFFKDFTQKFRNLKSSLYEFFDKDKIVCNILNSQSDIKLLGD